ncbi:serine hydrolase domain-containing protein [Devosia sediminis]|uniref:Beta-lactamase family protein n=1 Tax=Devosia sediminis TaxID=2798801 RepID=A0A934MJZ6_9HYPH|nr:serine hydrolase domain-containing protein [Devosia sediminis]MBJ3783615.1 beta-lactamase family protein [Devosia sediminis]
MARDVNILRQLQRMVEGALQPGAVVGVLRDDTVSLFAAGYMESESVRAMTPEAIFRISSMSKPIVALALLQQIEDGLIGLHDPVAEWLPELAHPRVLKRIDASLDDTVAAETPITVEHLLSSRLGLGILPMQPGATPIQREIDRLGLLGFGPDDPAHPMSQDEWMAHIGALPLLAQPGSHWFYNTATLVQGVLVSRIAGKPLSEVIAERITAPLGMVDTGFVVPDTKRHRLTAAYGGDMTETDAAGSSPWLRRQRFEVSMVSTAADYLAFARIIGRGGEGPAGRLIRQEQLRWMLSDHLTPGQRDAGAAFLDGRGWGYGLSVDAAHQIGSDFTGEVGWAGGLGTSWIQNLGSKAAVVILGCRAIDGPDVYAAHVDLTRQALG